VLWPSAHAVALHTTWRTSNPAVASVDSLGLVRARGIGAATVSATMAGVTQSSSIVVRPAP
jgi:hypothetical protein